MEEEKNRGRGSGFYATLAVCLLAVAAGGIWLILRRDVPEQSAVETAPRTETAEPGSAVLPDERPLVETLSPELMEESEASGETAEASSGGAAEPIRPVTVMPPIPTAEIDDTPVIAEEPMPVVRPLEGDVLAAFSMDALVYSETLADWRVHDGVDIAAGEGTEVLAACAGTVVSVTDDPLMGTTVVLRHDDGYETTYACLGPSPAVETGDRVSAGQTVGVVGAGASAESAQGPHLHFSVSKDGTAVDPEEFLG